MLDILDFVRMELEHWHTKTNYDPLYERKVRSKPFQYKHNRLKKFLHEYVCKVIASPEKLKVISRIADQEAFSGRDFHLERFVYCNSIRKELVKLLQQRASLYEIENLLDHASFEQEFVLLTWILFWEHSHGQMLAKNMLLEEDITEEYERQLLDLYKHFLDMLASTEIKTLEDLNRVEDVLIQDVERIDRGDLEKVLTWKKKEIFT